MNKELDVLLSDLVVFYHKVQSYHWLVSGHAFFQAHAKLEELYDGVRDMVDEVAEAKLMLGEKPVSRLSEFTALSKIQETDGEFTPVSKVFEDLLGDYKYLLESAKHIKALADEESNYLISTKMDVLIESFSKVIWMISQSQR